MAHASQEYRQIKTSALNLDMESVERNVSDLKDSATTTAHSSERMEQKLNKLMADLSYVQFLLIGTWAIAWLIFVFYQI